MLNHPILTFMIAGVGMTLLLGAVIGTCVQYALHDHKEGRRFGASQVKVLIVGILVLLVAPFA